MPIYMFECKNEECGVTYEELTSYDETGKFEGVKCPNCGSEEKILQPTACNFNFTNPIGTRRWRSHDYRFRHNLPNVIKERERAEQAANKDSGLTSADPYNHIDDISGGEHFGEVK
jgi:DNA-directed RNA polymerase subunit RPC12/RpoP